MQATVGTAAKIKGVSLLVTSLFCGNVAENNTRLKKKSPKKGNKQPQWKWKDADVKELISLMQEETIIFSLNNAKTPKEKSACYKVVKQERLVYQMLEKLVL